MFLSHARHLRAFWSFKRSGLQTMAAAVLQRGFTALGSCGFPEKALAFD